MKGMKGMKDLKGMKGKKKIRKPSQSNSHARQVGVLTEDRNALENHGINI